jgi:lipoprotein NlpD
MRHSPIRQLLDQARANRGWPDSLGSYRCAGSSRPRAIALASVLLLAACGSNPPAPVVDMSSVAPVERESAAPRSPAPGGTYRVVRGDTLYAIAFRNGVDYRELAAWNGIEPPYRIYAGQELRLSPASPDQATARATTAAAPAAATQSPSPAASVAAPAVASNGKPSASVFEDVPPAPQTPARDEAVSPSPAPPTNAPAPTASASASPPPKSTASEAPAKPVAEVPSPKPPAEAPVNGGGFAWRWPGKGALIGSYVAGDQTRQGIDIAGTAGDPVLAAGDGEVVYSGNGLLGYGELIIVKHNASFLSAYGHNRKRLVQEGERVKAGQQIAEMGSSASARDELHFEIRKNGKPVNPLDYLPPR